MRGAQAQSQRRRRTTMGPLTENTLHGGGAGAGAGAGGERLSLRGPGKRQSLSSHHGAGHMHGMQHHQQHHQQSAQPHRGRGRVSMSVAEMSSSTMPSTAGGGGGGGAGRRMSMGGGAGGGGRLSMRGSLSVRGGGGMRSSMNTSSMGASLGGGGTGGGKRAADPRPLKSPEWKAQAKVLLAEYLTDQNCDFPIQQRTLSRPTTKEFNAMVCFLFRKVDPNYAPRGAFPDEVVEMFRALGYPFTISKTGLVAVGTEHTWPNLLGALVWLVELLKYSDVAALDDGTSGVLLADGGSASGGARFGAGGDDSEDEAEEAAELEDVDVEAERVEEIFEKVLMRNEKAFMRYLGQAYAAFLGGDDDRYRELEGDFVGLMEERNQRLQTRLDGLTQDIEAHQTRIEEVRARTSQLPELQKKRDGLANDRTKFVEWVKEVTAHRDRQRERMGARTEELEQVRAQIRAVDADIATLQERIDKQELSAEDVEHMAQQRRRLDRGLDEVMDQRQTLQKSIWEREAAIEEAHNRLQTLTHEYTTEATALQLVPSNARNADGQDFSLHIVRRQQDQQQQRHQQDRDGATSGDDEEQDMAQEAYGEVCLSQDARVTLAPRLEAVRRAADEATRGQRERLVELMEAKDTLVEAVAESEDAKNALENKIARVEDAYKREKTNLERLVEKQQRDQAELDERVLSARDISEAEARTSAERRRGVELQSKLVAQRKEHERLKVALNSTIMEVAGRCADFQESTQQALAEARDMYQQKLEELAITPSGSSDSNAMNVSAYLPPVPSAAASETATSILSSPGATATPPAAPASTQNSPLVSSTAPLSSSSKSNSGIISNSISVNQDEPLDASYDAADTASRIIMS